MKTDSMAGTAYKSITKPAPKSMAFKFKNILKRILAFEIVDVDPLLESKDWPCVWKNTSSKRKEN